MTDSSYYSEWLRQIQQTLTQNQELFTSQNIAEQLQESVRRNQELFSSQNLVRQLQESLRRNQELFTSEHLVAQLRESLQRNQELFSSQNLVGQLQESLRRNQELFTSEHLVAQLRESLQRNQELLSSPVFREHVGAALRANSEALRQAVGDLGEVDEAAREASAVPGEAQAWAGWLLALSPVSKLALLNLLFGLLLALLTQAEAHGADIPPAISASIGTVVAVISCIIGLDALRDDS